MSECQIAQVEKELARTREYYRAVLAFPRYELMGLSSHAQQAHKESLGRLVQQGKELASELARLKSELS